MRVVYFANSHIPSDQANTVHVVNMAAALGSLGHDVTLWVYRGRNGSNGADEEEVGRVAAYFGVPPSFRLRYYAEPPVRGSSSLGAAAAVLTNRISGADFIVGRHAKACSLAGLLGLPAIFESHQPFAYFPVADRFLINQALNRRAFRGVVTISKPLAQHLKREIGARNIPLFVAHDAATPVEKVVPRQLGPLTRPQIGYVGHLYSGRGIEVVIELARRVPEADFHIIGGTAVDIARWRAVADISANVTFAGFVPPAEAAAMRLGCDILLAPYQPDASVPGGRVTTEWMSPLKIFEYMATGKAFISSDLPVLQEVLADRRNCLLVPPCDMDSWEAALRSLLSDKALRDTLGRTARAEFAAKYTWLRRAETIIQFGMQQNL